MRVGRIVSLVLVAACGGCSGPRTETTVSSLAEVRDEIGPDFNGRLLLDDGAAKPLADAQVLGGWICQRSRADSGCIAASRVKQVERDVYHQDGIATAFAAVIFSPIIAMYWWHGRDEDKEREQREQAELESLRQAIAARAHARGKPEPAPPTPRDIALYRSLNDMAACAGIEDEARRAAADGTTLAQAVWRTRETCGLKAAATWFVLNGETGKARRLTFLAGARNRFQDALCGGSGQGLDLPYKHIVADAPVTWMDEYRAVVVDPHTYDYAPQRGCADRTREEALAMVTSHFPLTDRAPALMNQSATELAPTGRM